MNKTLKIIFFFLLCLSFYHNGFTMGEKVVIKPLNVKTAQIRDEEVLLYELYEGGELTAHFHYVTRYDSNAGIAYLYVDSQPIDGSFQIPKHYTNYSEFDMVDIKNGTQLFYRRSSLDRYLTLKSKGTVYQETTFDYSNKIISSIEQIWDGYEMRNKKSKIPMKPGFQHWNIPMNALYAIGLRILDFSNPGIVYGIMPSVIKEPVPGRLKFIKKEEIKTKAGFFKTIKVGFQISDPFLGKLMESFTRETFLWIEDSPRALLIKDEEPGGWSFVLEKITTWKER